MSVPPVVAEPAGPGAARRGIGAAVLAILLAVVVVALTSHFGDSGASASGIRSVSGVPASLDSCGVDHGAPDGRHASMTPVVVAGPLAALGVDLVGCRAASLSLVTKSGTGSVAAPPCLAPTLHLLCVLRT